MTSDEAFEKFWATVPVGTTNVREVWNAALEWAKSGQEPVVLEKLFAELLKGTYSGKESYYNDEQISDACYAKGFEIALVAKKKGIELYTHPAPAQPVRLSGEEVRSVWEQLQDALCLDHKVFANAIMDKMIEVNR